MLPTSSGNGGVAAMRSHEVLLRKSRAYVTRKRGLETLLCERVQHLVILGAWFVSSIAAGTVSRGKSVPAAVRAVVAVARYRREPGLSREARARHRRAGARRRERSADPDARAKAQRKPRAAVHHRQSPGRRRKHRRGDRGEGGAGRLQPVHGLGAARGGAESLQEARLRSHARFRADQPGRARSRCARSCIHRFPSSRYASWSPSSKHVRDR